MPLIDSFDDPRLAHYRNLKDHELARRGGRFIAEGEQVVRRLLASDIAVESILVSQRKAETITPLAPTSTAMWIASDAVIQKIIGFQFHSGVMAVGVRPPPADLSAIASRTADRQTLVICPKITNTQNLGSLVRLCAGFGVDCLLLGPSCCDPFYRHCVRISMGSVFRLPIARSTDLHRDLADLRNRWNFQLIASVVAEDAQPLNATARPPRLALLFGNEAGGLTSEEIAACDRRVTIPMRLGTDSLNISIAAGIFLYHFVDCCKTI